jgi:hypothetical protein
VKLVDLPLVLEPHGAFERFEAVEVLADVFVLMLFVTSANAIK